ncbi:MAG TPA: hypothetical protein VGR06_21915 [Actinophytocola sp.]|uniref:hypothetical protein n=1 Tax=Actinophytocola sp. TaxID=1872138 RepID=UPI002E03F963|nr:hypothetical protein [Actinophytocola sp.]
MTSTELDALLSRIGRQRFLAHAFRPDRNGPDVLAFVRYWAGGTADVVIVFDEARASAFRTAGSGADVFAPELVSWWYLNNPVWTLRALMALPEPGHPDEPVEIMRPPPGCLLPAGGRMPVLVRARLP